MSISTLPHAPGKNLETTCSNSWYRSFSFFRVILLFSLPHHIWLSIRISVTSMGYTLMVISFPFVFHMQHHFVITVTIPFWKDTNVILLLHNMPEVRKPSDTQSLHRNHCSRIRQFSFLSFLFTTRCKNIRSRSYKGSIQEI